MWVEDALFWLSFLILPSLVVGMFGTTRAYRRQLRDEQQRTHYVRLIRRDGEDTHYIARLGHGSSRYDFVTLIESDGPLKARTEPKGK